MTAYTQEGLNLRHMKRRSDQAFERSLQRIYPAGAEVMLRKLYDTLADYYDILLDREGTMDTKDFQAHLRELEKALDTFAALLSHLEQAHRALGRLF